MHRAASQSRCCDQSRCCRYRADSRLGAGTLEGQAIALCLRLGGGGGVEAKKQFVHPKSASNVGPLLLEFKIFLGAVILIWVSRSAGVG